MDPHFPGLAPDNASRRAFLRRSALLSVTASATPWALGLAALGEAAAATATDYKALVCVFLYGGNDYANTVVPYDTASYAQYQALRSNVALARSDLAANALTPTLPMADGVQYALAPGLDPLVPLFHAGRLAVLANIGTLVVPTSKAAYAARSVPLPPKLFSHNDQQSYWQSSTPEGAVTGWGGRLGDLFAAANGNATFTCVGVSGNATFLSGQVALQYQVGNSGPIAVLGMQAPLYGSSACSAALRSLMSSRQPQLLEDALASVGQRSIDAYAQLNLALATGTLQTVFPSGNSLADQLKIVARMIAARSALGARRQVFFVSLGGFDNHDGLATVHPGLMTTVGGALAAFYNATVELGVASQVTTFTASDFGRTLVSNNDGSDHGWGSFQFVLGDSVIGASVVGKPPVLANNGPSDVGQGRLLPTLAVDQLAATLARWFGASATDTAMVVPNLANFNTKDLGFLRLGV